MVLISLILACGPKKEPLQAPHKEQLVFVALLDAVDQPTSEALPEELLQSLGSTVDKHNLSIRIVDAPAERQTEQRLKSLSSSAPLLLIEAKATFQSQLQGRFRWEVECTMSLLDDQEQLVTRSFTTPVFHKFHHQREQDSLLAAEPVLLRQLDSLLEDYIRGM